MTVEATPTIDLNAENDDGEAVLAELPRWRRPRKLRRQLAGTLVLIALASVVLIGGLNFVAARQLLDEGTEDQLVGVGEARARTIEQGLERTLGQIAAAAADLSVVEALSEFDEAFTSLADAELEPSQLAEFNSFYEDDVVGAINDAGLGPVTVEDARPQSAQAEYLQYHYVVSEPEPEARAAVSDPGDGSAYSDVHAERHEDLASLAEALGVGDLKLISADTADVVYTTDKRVDFATDLQAGPYQDSQLAETVLDRLDRVRIGEAVFSDIEIYIPGGARPVMFAAAGVREDTEVIGALVVELPIEALNLITTVAGMWEEVGLASGESYVVGSDLILRSESRQWIEDPEAYLDKVDDDELASLIETLGSPVGIQPVDTEPVTQAFDGTSFKGTTKNYLGQETFSYATQIDTPGVEWVMVADIPLSDAREPLYDYARRLGLVLLILLPIAAIIGVWMANRLTRPIPPVVDAALAVAEGERDPVLPEMGNDEFGDLARRLRQMAGDLERQENELAEEFENKRKLLLTVLPTRMVEDDGGVKGTGDVVETATVIAISIAPADWALRHDEEDLANLLGRALELAETMAVDYDIERIRAAVDRYLFLAGIGNDDDRAAVALEFASSLAPAIIALGAEEDIPLVVRIGLSSGPVATGMLETGNLTFAAWGEPVRRALAIGALSRSDEILVDASTADSAGPTGLELVPANDVVDLDGQAMTLFALSGVSGPEPHTD